MLENLIILILVLFFIWVVLFQKRGDKRGIDLMKMFTGDDGNMSFMRFASFICLWLFVWIVKRSVGVPVEEVNLELIVIVGGLAFFPKLIQKFVEKYANKK